MLKGTLNKGISTPIAIGVVLILVVVVGGFTWWQYSEMWWEESKLPDIEFPEKGKEEAGVKIAGWETYRNEDYRVEIKYPSDYEIDQSVSPSHKRETFRIYKENFLEEIRFNYLINDYGAPPGDTCCGGCKFEEEGITIEGITVYPIIHSEVPSKSPHYYEPHVDTLEECEVLPLIEHTVFGEFCVDEDFNYQGDSCKKNDDNFLHQFFLTCRGEKFEGIKGKDECYQLFTQIIPTFRFIKEEQKTYQNRRYGYEIKYPNDWKRSKNVLGAFDIHKDLNGHRCSIEIYANKDKHLYPIKEAKEYFQGFSESLVSIKQEEVSIGNVSAIKVSSPELAGREIYFFEENIGSYVYFGEERKGRDYFFNIFLDITDLDYSYDVLVGDDECKEVFNQIISNFKVNKDAYIKELTDEPVCQYRRAKFEMRIQDSQGRVTGEVDGKIKEEIPGSYCTRNEETNETNIRIPPYVTPAKIEIFGITSGNYVFGLKGDNPKKKYESVTFNATDIPIVPGVLHHYVFDWETLAEGKEGIVIFIDVNNDGVFEKTINSDDKLTCEEFIIQLKKR